MIVAFEGCHVHLCKDHRLLRAYDINECANHFLVFSRVTKKHGSRLLQVLFRAHVTGEKALRAAVLLTSDRGNEFTATKLSASIKRREYASNSL